MKRLLLIAALACVPSWASIALVAHGKDSIRGVATTAALNMTGANLIVAFVGEYSNDPTAGTMSDSSGNTWTHLGLYQSAGNNRHATAWYCLNPTVSSSQTFSFSNGGDFNSIYVSGWSGVATISAFDKQNGFGSTSPVTSIQPGSITPSASGSLVLSFVTNANNTSVVPTIGSSFTVMDYDTSGTPGIGDAYLIQVTAGAVNPTWTVDSDYTVAMIVSFLPAGGGGASKTCTLSLLGAGPC